MKTITIVGVPEHFNLPWHMAIEEGAFSDRGIDLQWYDIPEGTGRMCEMLENGETDLAIILTEGLIKSKVEGNPVKIVQEFIASPLFWGIHVAADSDFHKVSELQGTSAAISRYGSGSHLMAYLNAQNQGWNTNTLGFEVVDTLDGAIEALSDGNADYFLWERFTTMPVVDQGIFRRLDDCPTPWPCFVIAATEEFLASETATLGHILEIINAYTAEFKQIPSIDRTLANRYGQELDAIREWMSLTRWSQSQLRVQDLKSVQDTLRDLKLIDKTLNPSEILF